jgi:hypothetical protein
MTLLGLSGKSSQVQIPPQICESCGAKKFYKQPDFKRSIGVTVVSLASLVSFVMMAMGFDWFLFMSPMLAALIVDRFFAYTRPLAMICYKCGHIYRGLSEEQLQAVETFDLETYDRIHYSERTGEALPED